MLRTVLVGALLTVTACSAQAADPGVTDSEIKMGQTMPYSGPASGYAITGRVEAAYYEMINAKGGVNGRKIKFISLDDAYSPSKTVEQTRKLVEQDEVLAMFSSVGTAPNISVQKYLNGKHVPQIFVSSGATALILSGGTASATVVAQGGIEIVLSGGTNHVEAPAPPLAACRAKAASSAARPSSVNPLPMRSSCAVATPRPVPESRRSGALVLIARR